MNTNQIFNWNRFTATLRREAVENWRMLLLVPVGIYLWFTFRLLTDNLLTGTTSVVNGGTFSFIAAMIASLAFPQLSRKSRRMSLLISPSSTAEKYIVNVLLYVIAIFVLFPICLQLADCTRWAILAPFKSETLAVAAPDNFSRTLTFWKSIVTEVHFAGYNTVTELIEFFGVGVIFFAGSLLWPRLTLPKTFAVLITLLIIKMLLGYWLLGISIDDNVNPVSTGNMGNIAEISNIVFDVALFVGCWIASWYLFKHKDVISRKWWK